MILALVRLAKSNPFSSFWLLQLLKDLYDYSLSVKDPLSVLSGCYLGGTPIQVKTVTTPTILSVLSGCYAENNTGPASTTECVLQPFSSFWLLQAKKTRYEKR